MVTDRDKLGRRRSPITFAEYRLGKSPPNKGKRYPAEPLTYDEVQRLIAACSNRGSSGIRNRAAITLMWRAGVRVGELVALYPKDIDTRAGSVTVLHGKGDKRRVIGLDPQACAVVDVWAAKRAKLGLTARSPLFCTVTVPGKGGPIAPAYFRTMLKRIGEQAEIDKRVHPHGLRHTAAFELANEGVPVHVIQAQLGHKSLATTDQYVRHLAPRQLLDAMGRREWGVSHPAPSVAPTLRVADG